MLPLLNLSSIRHARKMPKTSVAKRKMQQRANAIVLRQKSEKQPASKRQMKRLQSFLQSRRRQMMPRLQNNFAPLKVVRFQVRQRNLRQRSNQRNLSSPELQLPL